MPLGPDRELLHYRLIEPLGAGGMGEVWRARDPDLDREVAIKVLPEALAGDPERLARFEREARVLASLNHPNIAGVHGLHEADGLRFLAMELVPGEDLRRILDRGPLGVAETLEVGRQVAAALEAAHSAGVVHRDLKPANGLRTPSGQIRLVDFGLARSGPPHPGSDPSWGASRETTRLADATREGMILGTPAYMSPEQARGLPIDRRTDLWSFGCLLYECLTGAPCFEGQTVTDVLAAILHRDPDLGRLPETTPPRLARLVRLCLEKKPADRWRDAGDAILELETAEEELGAALVGTGIGAGTVRRPLRAALLGSLLLALGLVLGYLVATDGPPAESESPRSAPRVLDVTIDGPAGIRPSRVRISPDGSTILVTAMADGSSRGFLRRLDEAAYRELPLEMGYEFARFSPDSTELVFVSSQAPGIGSWGLVRVPSDLSAPGVLIAPWEEGWLTDLVWVTDEEIAVVAQDPLRLQRIPLSGGSPRREIPIRGDEEVRSFLLHSTMPDGSILGTVESWTGGYHQDPARLDPESGELAVLVDRGFEPTWAPPGLLVFSRRDQLLVAKLGLSAIRPTSPPRAAAEGLRSDVMATAAGFGLSRAGDLVHLTGGVIGARRRFVEIRADGTVAPWDDVERAFHPNQVDDSQDGRVLAAVQVSVQGLFEILAGETGDPGFRIVLAQEGMDCDNPSVSPDGSWIAGTCLGDPSRDGVWLAPFSGRPSEARRIAEHGDRGGRVPNSWLPDGSGILIREQGENGRLLRLDLDPDGEPLGEPREIPGLGREAVFGMVSPDGRLFGVSEWDGSTYSLKIGAWNDGEPAPGRPVARTRDSGFDWCRPLGDGTWHLSLSGRIDGPSHIAVDSSGRRIRDLASPVPDALDPRIYGRAYLQDGRVFAVEAEPAELEPARIRIVTGWASRLRP